MPDRTKYFIHPKAVVESSHIGEGTRIWAFCNVQQKARIGSGCNICDHCFIENNVIIGNDVTVKNGVSLWDGVVVEDSVFIGPHAVFTNDVYPRSKVYRDQFDKILIREGATIGANATIIAGHTIGCYAFVGAGAVVTCDIPDFTLWYGNPARLAGYVCRCAARLQFNHETPRGTEERAVCACGLAYRLREGLVVPE
jgi:acetyltransferase-like isoleucine patch superfamily enzyme